MSRWVGDGWARRDSFFRPKGSRFQTPSREPSPEYAALRAVAVEARRPRLK